MQLFWFFSVFCDFKRAASSKDLATALIFIRVIGSTGEAMEARLFYVVLGSISRRQQSLEESSNLRIFEREPDERRDFADPMACSTTP